MANPNPTIWGDSSSWIYSERAYGLETTVSRLAKCDKPKIANFNPNASTGYKGSLLEAINTAEKMTINQYIDNSICPCGQDPKVSPYGKIALLNENNELSTTPSRVITVSDSNINWFFADSAKNSGNNNYYYHTTYTTTSSSRLGLNNEQFAPKAQDPTTSTNTNMVLCPYVYYGLKSLVLSIEVCCAPSTITNPTSGYTWRTLNSWKNDYSDEIIIGLRLFVRNCTAIDGTTLALTYNNDRPISSGQASFICVTNPININNNGVMTDTQLLSIFGTANDRSVTIFARTPQIYNYNDTRRAVVALPCWDYFDGQECARYKPISSDPVAYFFYKIPYSDDTYEKIMKIAALYGCFFTPSGKYQFDNDMLDNDLYLPILDENGVAHGQYTRGAANATNPLYSKNSIRDIDYDPTKPPTPTDPNTYSVTTGFNTVGNVASTTKAYVVNGAALTGLSGEMWNILNNLVTTPDDMTNLDNLTLDAFLTNNPIDAIVSVKKYPLLSVPHAENLENIYLGKYQTGAAGYALAMQQARYNFEGIPIFPKFGNCFLDYSPYTKMQLYVPFCGTIDIDAADFMGRTLSVEMVIDFITGAVTAYVLANQLVVTSLTGNCGIDIAITGTEQSTVSAALENAILQDKSARGNYALKGSVGSMLTNPIGNITHPTTAIENRFSTKMQTMQANYNLQHVEMPLRQIGNASPLNSWELEFVCRLIIYYPDGECISFNATNEPSLITEKVESFGAVNGFATVETSTLSSFTGFTQVSDADLSGISATDTEKEMLLSLLQSGVYL